MKIVDSRIELFDLVPKHSVGAEVGVFLGKFSEQIISKVNPRRYFLIDLFENNEVCSPSGKSIISVNGHVCLSTVSLKFKRHFQPCSKTEFCIMASSSKVALESLTENSLDFIYIDGAHDFEYVWNDLQLSKRVVKPGGYIMGHDFQSSFPGIDKAVGQFLQTYNFEIAALSRVLEHSPNHNDRSASYAIINRK